MPNPPAGPTPKAGIRAAELALMLGSIAVALGAFLLFDALYSKRQTDVSLQPPAPRTNGRSLYLSKPSGWYELNPGYNGEDRYGPHLIKVRTDGRGFRVPLDGPATAKGPRPASPLPALVFLGDSFTYGVGASWEQTFVGQVARRYGGEVINAGVISHAPTAHRYRLERMLQDGRIPPGAIVIMAVDISDVQDEASRWVPGPGEPRERQSAAAAAVVQRQETAAQPQPWFSPQRFQLSHRIYAGLESAYKQLFDHWQVRNLDRSAFTHRPWAELEGRYQPLGVAGGLQQLRQQLQQAARLSASRGHPFWILIYPWPAQLAYDARFSWERFIAGSCEPGVCSGVINTFGAFRQAVGPDRNSALWQNRLYLRGDVHFTPTGNALVAEAVLAALQPR